MNFSLLLTSNNHIFKNNILIYVIVGHSRGLNVIPFPSFVLLIQLNMCTHEFSLLMSLLNELERTGMIGIKFRVK